MFKRMPPGYMNEIKSSIIITRFIIVADKMDRLILAVGENAFSSIVFPNECYQIASMQHDRLHRF